MRCSCITLNTIEPSQMDQLEHQPWNISIQAKSSALCFRLRASHLLASCGNGGGSRLSLFLRISSYLFQVKSGTGVLARRQTRCSKLFHFFAKVFRPKRLNFGKHSRRKKGLELRKPGNEILEDNAGLFQFLGPMATMMGSLSLLSHSASEKDIRGIFITFVLFSYIALMFNKRRSPFSLVLVAMVVSGIASYSLNRTSCIGPVPKAAWLTWISFLSCGGLTALSQSLFKMSSESMKTAAEGAPVLISNLLLTCQALIHMLILAPKNPQAIGVYMSSAFFWVKKKQDIVSWFFASCLADFLSIFVSANAVGRTSSSDFNLS